MIGATLRNKITNIMTPNRTAVAGMFGVGGIVAVLMEATRPSWEGSSGFNLAADIAPALAGISGAVTGHFVNRLFRTGTLLRAKFKFDNPEVSDSQKFTKAGWYGGCASIGTTLLLTGAALFFYHTRPVG